MNLDIYNNVRAVPAEAKKEIRGGRLNGKTDINPMWRIKKLTEQFGPCGIGWKYTIDREWLETGANGEISAFMDISYVVSRRLPFGAGNRRKMPSEKIKKRSQPGRTSRHLRHKMD